MANKSEAIIQNLNRKQVIEEALELVLAEAEKKLELIEADCKNGSIEEYQEFKESLELIESIVLKSIDKGETDNEN
jgi:hypothetical protein